MRWVALAVFVLSLAGPSMVRMVRVRDDDHDRDQPERRAP